jgi:uncharacterized protein YjbJ (UPF0337 family)
MLDFRAQFRAGEDDVGGQIEPGQQNDDAAERAVSPVVAADFRDVGRKGDRAQDPERCCRNRSPAACRPISSRGGTEFTCTIGDVDMNKDRIVGAVKEIKGSIKETVGKTTGDAKLEADGRADKVEGKVQNAIGGLKDTLKN